jgi:hypothetical protein
LGGGGEGKREGGERVDSILKNKIFGKIIHFLSTNNFSLKKLHF